MNRRQFLTFIGSVAVSRPLVVRAQTAKFPVIGFLVPGSQASQEAWVTAFAKRLVQTRVGQKAATS